MLEALLWLWQASGDGCQAAWERLLDVTGKLWMVSGSIRLHPSKRRQFQTSHTGDDPFDLWVIGSTGVTFTVYWLFGGLFTLADCTGRPRWLRRYKTQPGTNEPVDPARLRGVIASVLLNQLAIGVPLTLFTFEVLRARGLAPIRQLPTFAGATVDIACCVLIEEIGFYYSHRALHSPALYRLVHKRHHEWTAPVAVTAVYCHPVEHVLSNLLPPFAGVLVMGAHVTTAWVWFSMAILSTLNAHCGYHLPLLPSPEAHDFHHLKFSNCFGVLGWLDRLHGTDALFRRTVAFKRHVQMLGVRPAREVWPDGKRL